jgi:hypothetical protein
VLGLSRHIRLRFQLVTPLGSPERPLPIPQPPRCNAPGLSHSAGLGCSPFARRYLGNIG